jgi:hypothetical protein
MDKDFPTVTTNLLVNIAGREHAIEGMDVSYGLKLLLPPQPLEYQATFGNSFRLPLACPFDLQIAWKLHQCMVRPRFKDIFDLTMLLRENSVDPHIVWSTLSEECTKDKTPLERFNLLIDGRLDLHPMWKTYSLEQFPFAAYFDNWRNRATTKWPAAWYDVGINMMYLDYSDISTDGFEFLNQLAEQLQKAGFKRLPQSISYPPIEIPSPPPGFWTRLFRGES